MKTNDSARQISEQIVEAAWLEIGGFEEDQLRRYIKRLSASQPALLAFVTACSEDLGRDAAELGVYMFAVIVRMYEQQFGKRLQNVGPKRIESIYDEYLAALSGLADAHEKWVERNAEVLSVRQPWVWKYVTECMFEPDDESINLSEEDQGSLAIIMKTVIDALDSSVN